MTSQLLYKIKKIQMKKLQKLKEYKLDNTKGKKYNIFKI